MDSNVLCVGERRRIAVLPFLCAMLTRLGISLSMDTPSEPLNCIALAMLTAHDRSSAFRNCDGGEIHVGVVAQP